MVETSIPPPSSKEGRVVVFGIFDGVHNGHRDLFRQAREYGDALIVILGRDGPARSLKSKDPRHSQEERLELVRQEPWVSDVALGDEEQSSYRVLQRLSPDVICLGYDQQALGEDLKRWMTYQGKEIPIHFLKPFKPNIFHNSLLS
ncbi:MAG: adenylyltransferase/cytidyltransferase family protein [Dehalococcoidia bacterium]